MQATLDFVSLKPFIKALTCLSKYGDDLVVYATPDSLALSSTNLAKSAYCSFTYNPDFFTRYSVGDVTRSRARGPRGVAEDIQEVQPVTSQLLTKSLLSILKHRNLEKSAQKCELSIIEGSQHSISEEPDTEDGRDSLESRLVVRLHCKHGVVKTHRLLLNTPTSNFVPLIPQVSAESRINVSPQAVKEIIEHFPHAKGPKTDPQLVWSFDELELKVRTMESNLGAKGTAQLSTELTVGADEFDLYDVYAAPMTIAFHLREFNASIAFAESLNLPLELRFTYPAEPLFISADTDDCQVLCVISTFQVREKNGNGTTEQRRGPAQSSAGSSGGGASVNGRKRGRDDEGMGRASGSGDVRKSAKVVQKPGPEVLRHDSTGRSQSRLTSSTPQHQLHSQQSLQYAQDAGQFPDPDPSPEPLFLPSQPSHSQPTLSQLGIAPADEAVLRASGLGIEDMNADEFAAMLEGEGEEVGVCLGSASQGFVVEEMDYENRDEDGAGAGADGNTTGTNGFELDDDEIVEMGPTQTQRSTGNVNEKAFKPLFKD